MLEVRGVAVGWGASTVVGGVDAVVEPGQVLALVGVNGAGKSTLLRALAGLHPLQSGDVLLDGEPLDERRPDHRAAVAAVVDEDSWFPGLCVAEHLRLVAAGHGVVDATQVVAAELVAWSLQPVADDDPWSLSSGQRRRLLLATAFVRPRRLLLLDEPEARLDVAGRALVADRIRREADGGCAMVLATHDPALLAVATGCLMLDTGEAVGVTPAEAADRVARTR